MRIINSGKLLGYYLPSFFYIEIETDHPFDDLNTLTDEDKSTLFHEYTHFLQDITTTFGLTNIINTVNVQKAINEEILKEEHNTEFYVPVSIENYKDTDVYDKLHDMFYGDFESEFSNYSIIEKIEFVENEIIEEHEDKQYVKVSFSTFEKKSSFIFGGVQIMENMAFLVERNLFDHVNPPVYPYRIVEKVIEYIYPELLVNDIIIITICDYSLMTPDPGKFLVEFINKLKELKINDIDNIYEVLKTYTFKSKNSEELSVFQLYEERYILALNSIKEYFTIEHFESIKKWLDSIFKDLSTFKLENFNFWKDILSLDTKESRRSEFTKMTQKFGFPLISNGKGKVVFSHPKHYPDNLLALKAINEVSKVLNGSLEPCGMKVCCKNSLTDITNNKCDTPWLRGSEDPLCPFGQIIKMWGISTKLPKPYN